MTQSSEADQETNLEQKPFSEEEWAQIPPAAQAFVQSLIVRIQTLEAEVAALHERLNRNSRNSSQPPSSDGPAVNAKPRRRAKGKRKRGAQPGHKGTTRKQVPIEQVKESHDVKPDACRCCGNALGGADPVPYRHQVTEIPPVVAEVIEYRLHTLTCSICRAETRAELPAGVPKGAFAPRLQAMVALSSGRYRLSKRNSVDIIADFFQTDVSLGAVSALEQRTSEAISDPVEQARESLAPALQVQVI